MATFALFCDYRRLSHDVANGPSVEQPRTGKSFENGSLVCNPAAGQASLSKQREQAPQWASVGDTCSHGFIGLLGFRVCGGKGEGFGLWCSSLRFRVCKALGRIVGRWVGSAGVYGRASCCRLCHSCEDLLRS